MEQRRIHLGLDPDADGAWRVLFHNDNLDYSAPPEARDARLIEQRIEALPARCPQSAP